MKVETELTLPIELATSDLSLEEIGAIFVLFSVIHTKDSGWIGNSYLEKILKSLQDRGILSMSTSKNGDVNLDLDLT